MRSHTALRWMSSQSLETYIAVLAAIGILAHLVLRYLAGVGAPAVLIPLYVTLVAGGLPLVITLARKLFALEFGSDLLAGISILTAVLLGQYLVGSIIVLMLSGGAALEHHATRRASSVLEALAKRMLQTAHLKAFSGITDISLGEIAIGDNLIIFPHEICPVDGVVVEGHGTMDESYLTGEPYEMSKIPGSRVLSGAINGDAALTIMAEKLAGHSRYAKIMQMMRATKQKRPHLRRLGDCLGAWYTPGCSCGRWPDLALHRRSASLSCGRGGGHTLSPDTRYSGCRYRGYFAGCQVQHHHQKSHYPGADHQLPHADFRQDRNPYLRQACAHRNRMRSQFRSRPRITHGCQCRAILQTPAGSCHPGCGACLKPNLRICERDERKAGRRVGRHRLWQ